MKRNPNQTEGSFSTLLVKNFLLLTLALFLTIGAVQMLVANNLNRALPVDDVDGLLSFLSLSEPSELQDSAINQFIQPKAFLQIYDENANLLYGKNAQEIRFSKEELTYVQEYQGDVLYRVLPFLTAKGEERYLLTAQQLERSLSPQNGYMILDGDLNVLENHLPLKKESFTQQEFNVLTGNSLEDGSFYRKEYINSSGEKRTVVFSLPPFSEADYSLAMTLWEYSWVIMGAIYFVLVGISIYWLDKKTKSFLRPLDTSITSLLSDGPTQLISYEGPKEFVDIYSRFNELAKRLEQSEDQREKLDTAKNKMLTDISHDLRTPITVIQGYSKALHDGLVPEEKVQLYLDTIHQKSLQMAKLINAFFEYSKLSHPHLPLEKKEIDLGEFCTNYLAENYKEIDVAGFQLEVDIPDTKILAHLDPLQMRRALDNLLSNSLKYNPPGTKIYFSLLEEQSKIRLLFGDDGEGIPKEIEESLFEPFVVGDESRGNNSTGLGLAISARIIGLHLGKLRLIPGQAPYKTLFEITLPKAKDPS